MSKTQQQIVLLLLIIVLGNVGYWAMNKKFLHEEIIAMITGQPTTPPLVLEPELPQAPQPAPEAAQVAPQLVPQAATPVVSLENEANPINEEINLDDPVELINSIAGLEAEIGNLEMQADEISEVVDQLSSQAELTNLKLDEIKATFGLSDEDFQALLLETQSLSNTVDGQLPLATE